MSRTARKCSERKLPYLAPAVRGGSRSRHHHTDSRHSNRHGRKRTRKRRHVRHSSGQRGRRRLAHRSGERGGSRNRHHQTDSRWRRCSNSRHRRKRTRERRSARHGGRGGSFLILLSHEATARSVAAHVPVTTGTNTRGSGEWDSHVARLRYGSSVPPVGLGHCVAHIIATCSQAIIVDSLLYTRRQTA
jgi:hypothetical protein